MARNTSSSNVALPDAPAGATAARSAILNLLASMRPGQWSKNLLLFAGLLFGQRLRDPGAVIAAGVGFLLFCALSGSVYLINDILDRDHDRRHPLKAVRPVASGALAVPTALGAAIVLITVGLGVGLALNVRFGVAASVYVALLGLYSGPLKHIVIIDVLTVAAGFVVRAVAGALVVEVEISHWLLVCTILLALFLALAKRRHELVLLADGATSHRPTLGEYSPYLLDQMIAVVTASTLIAYVFYTISPETQQKFATPWLGLTIPFPLYGIFRYLYLVHQRDEGGSPADLLLTDRPLLTCVALWALSVVAILYR
jgi:4-hydroxybenzoate polyprenyltransferase